MGLDAVQVYFDSCIVIYLVEEHPTFAPLVQVRLEGQIDDDDTDAVVLVSELTEMECLVKPLRDRNQALLDKYREWFDTAEVLPASVITSRT